MKKIYVTTIGFTKSTAENFFERLFKSQVKTVLDIRLHNTSQLAGFAKSDDLAYFLNKLGGVRYVHQPLLAPTDEILKEYKKQKGDWIIYKEKFFDLLNSRKVETTLKPEIFDGSCLLCSEAEPHRCHRQLVCEYLNVKWNGTLSVTHL